MHSENAFVVSARFATSFQILMRAAELGSLRLEPVHSLVNCGEIGRAHV
jgi:hypothetical protein